MPYAIDLFCGAGGMSEGIIQAGFHILFSNDINQDVEATYVNRHEQLGFRQKVNTYFHKCDIRELEGKFIKNTIRNLDIFKESKKDFPKEIDAIFGGPPCQGFSRAGKRDPNDPRNLLFKDYLRIISEINPKYVVMENVEGFMDTKFYNFIGVTGQLYENESLAPEILKNELNQLDYNVLEPKVLDASDYGVPQRRKRAIFIAFRKGQKEPQYPKPTYNSGNKITVLNAISDLIKDLKLREFVNSELTDYQIESIQGRTPNIDGNTISSRGELFNVETSRHLPIIIERFSLFKEGEDGAMLRKRIKNEGIDIISKKYLLEDCCNKLEYDKEEIIKRFKVGDVTEKMLDILLTKKSIRTRLDRNKQSLTVVTLPDDYLSPFENRTFSVREMARLQSFDDSFVFLGKRTTGGARRRFEVPQYTQVGNAVPPLLAKAIAFEIRKVL